MVLSTTDCSSASDFDHTWIPPLNHLFGADDELLSPNEMDAFLRRLRAPPSSSSSSSTSTSSTCPVATRHFHPHQSAHLSQPPSRIQTFSHQQQQRDHHRQQNVAPASVRSGLVPRKNKDKVVSSVRNPNNPRVFMDVTIGNQRIGRLLIELFADVVPITAENFRCLCTGEKKRSQTTGRPLHFLGTKFHRVLPGFALEGGDLHRGNGCGGESIYGECFADENFILKHDRPGLLSMNNSGRNTNSSQFFVMLDIAPWMDGTNVVFGQVIEGIEVVRRVERTPTNAEDKPKKKVCIADCGEWIPGVTPDYIPVPSTTSQFRRVMAEAGMHDRIKIIPQARGGRKRTKREDCAEEIESTISGGSAKDDEEIVSSGDEDLYNVELNDNRSDWMVPQQQPYSWQLSNDPSLSNEKSPTSPVQLVSKFLQYQLPPQFQQQPRSSDPSPNKQPRLFIPQQQQQQQPLFYQQLF